MRCAVSSSLLLLCCFSPIAGSISDSFFSSAYAASGTLAAFDAAGLHIELSSEERGAYRMAISTLTSGTRVPSPKLMVLQSPSRFVIDIPGMLAKGTKTIRLRDPWVSALRYSTFGGGSRFVFDFRPRTEPRYVWQTNPLDGSLIIRFSLDPADLSRPPQEIPRETPRPTPRPRESEPESFDEDIVEEPVRQETPLPRPTAVRTPPLATPVPTAIPTPAPTVARTPVPQPTAQAIETEPAPGDTPDEPAPAKAVLSGLAFRLTGKTKVPSVVFSIRGLEEYSLNNVGEGTYELLLKGVQVENRSLLLPAMPPENFERFEMVVPRVAGGNVRVKIRVEKGVSLIPFVSGEELWIKAWGER